MPEPTITRRLANTRDRELVNDDGPHSRDLELREEALRLGRELLRGTKYEEQR